MCALGDYSCDERGDVGCWTREAACVHLAHLEPNAALLSGPLLVEAVGRLVEIFCGRMDRLRGPARTALLALLRRRDDPVLDELRRVFAQDLQEEDAWWDEGCGCLLVAAPVAVGEGALLGLAASVGGRAPAAAARAALLRFVAGQAAAQEAIWRRLAPAVLTRRNGDERVAGPLLAVLELLLRNGCFAGEEGGQLRALCRSCMITVGGGGNVVLLCTGLDLLCALLRLPDRDGAALRSVAELLDHPYPRVRQHAALRLHVALAAGDVAAWPLHDETRAQVEALLIEGASQENNANVAKQVWALLDSRTHIQ